MANYPRYAIYYAPEANSVLDRFGTELLGYDAHRGIDVPFPAGMEPPDWHELTQDPRRYGFHATLKPPMSLSPDANEEEMLAACAVFASKPRKIPVIKPVIEIISGFVAVVPATASADVERLAADCVRDFEPFRAPLTEEDRGRRNPSKLTPRQLEYLDRWGYPYVFEEFRFHMTLTGRLELSRREKTLTMLRRRFSSLDIVTLAVDRIALFRQSAAEARFEIIGHWPLTMSTRVSKTTLEL
jgi:putative phosphonate metabolism protein